MLPDGAATIAGFRSSRPSIHGHVKRRRPCLPIVPVTEAAIDLAQRWSSARRAALRATLPESDEVEPEDVLLARALAHAPEAALRRVFDVSMKLGEGFRRFHGLDLPLAQLVELLPLLGPPCTARSAVRVEAEPAYRTERDGCLAAAQHPRTCDYWREAVEGLVLGMTGAVRHARHESVGHGGARCVDVLYVHPQSRLRFGPIPEHLQAGLESLRRTARAFDSSVEIEFLGLSESVLHYSCRSLGSGGDVRLNSVIEQGLRRRFPWLSARDVSPRPVLVESPS